MTLKLGMQHRVLKYDQVCSNDDTGLTKETKAKFQKAERLSYWQFVDNIIEVGYPGQETKMFWSDVKSLHKDTSGIAPLKDNGKLHTDPKDKADIPMWEC